MEVTFQCECDADVSAHLDGMTTEPISCTHCGAVYAVTITQLRAGRNRR